MNGEELGYFKGLVQGKIDETLCRMSDVATDTPRDASGDLSGVHTHMADSSLGVDEIDCRFTCDTRRWRYLHHLNEALKRIKDGGYGICRTCGGEISEDRLKAVPHATQCIACKELEEQNAHSHIAWRARV